MTALLVADVGKVHQGDAMRCLAQGLKLHGMDVVTSQSYRDGDWSLVATWGAYPCVEAPHLILEAGYVNGNSGNYVADRLKYISTSWNRLHGESDGFHVERPSDRWDVMRVDLKPWRTDGDYALVMDQHPGDSCAPPARLWEECIGDIRRDYDVKVRPHPLIGPAVPLTKDLADAFLAITWSSTAAVESVIEGVPTVALHPRSIAYPVTSHDVHEAPYLGDREQWAYNLAYRQWTLAELSSGEAWSNMYWEPTSGGTTATQGHD